MVLGSRKAAAQFQGKEQGDKYPDLSPPFPCGLPISTIQTEARGPGRQLTSQGTMWVGTRSMDLEGQGFQKTGPPMLEQDEFPLFNTTGWIRSSKNSLRKGPIPDTSTGGCLKFVKQIK